MQRLRRDSLPTNSPQQGSTSISLGATTFTPQETENSTTGNNPVTAAELIRNIGGKNINQCQKNLKEREKNGKLFSEDERRQIQQMSQNGMDKWLRDVGITTHQEAHDYLETGNYKDWLKLKAGKRLLIKSLAVANDPRNREMPSPAYTQGLSQQIRTDDQLSEDEKSAKIEERDGYIRNAFINTLKERKLPENVKKDLIDNKKYKDKELGKIEQDSAKASDILTKIFLILQSGLQVYDAEQERHIDYKEGDVARALAHGGRVNIRIPKIKEGEKPKELTDWIGITEKREDRNSKHAAPVYRRNYGTHHMKITKDKDGNPGEFEEEGGTTVGIKSFVGLNKIYGLDISAGGLGKKDCNGDTILPDGVHGHVFIGFYAPTNQKHGALQIGIETTAPGANSLTGYKHNILSTEATANPESSFHGDKKDKIGQGKLKDNQRFIDLDSYREGTSEKTWLNYLEDVKEDWQKYLEENGSQAYEELVNSAFGTLVGKRKYFGYDTNQGLIISGSD